MWSSELAIPDPQLRTSHHAAVEDDNSTPLDHDGINFLQRVVGKTLYLARMVNSPIELAVNRIASNQAHGTTRTMRAAHRLLQ